MPRHTIQQGETLFLLAAKHGLSDWKVILDHYDNRAYKRRYPDPGVLPPGVRIIIPNKKLAQKPSAVDQLHQFQLQPPTAWMRVAVRDWQGNPLANKTCKLEVSGGETFEGALDATGVLSRRVAVTAKKAKLTVNFTDSKTRVWNLVFGWKDPISTISGVQARLDNLGFSCGVADGILNSRTKAAIKAFRTVTGLAVNEKIDQPLRDKLAAYYDLAKDEKALDKTPLWPLYKNRVAAGLKRYADKRKYNPSAQSKAAVKLLDPLVTANHPDKLRRAVSWLMSSSLLRYEHAAQLKTSSSLYGYLDEELKRDLRLGDPAAEARVQLTATGTSGGDKLREPLERKYGVTALRLEKGGTKTHTYLSAEARPKTAPAATGKKDFNFAPSLDSDKVKVTYVIEDPEKEILKARLELYHLGKEDALWSQDLAAGDLTAGSHTLTIASSQDWDGKVTGSGVELPDDYPTVEHSPYQLRLKVSDRDNLAADEEVSALSPVAWCDFQVLVKEISLELGDKKAVKGALDQALYDTLTFPAGGSTEKVQLISNLYKTDGVEMNDNTQFTEYKTLWGDGPQIPVFAKLWVQDSAGAKKEAPKALGKVKTLWDWESVDEVTTGHRAPVKNFIDKALDYYKSKSKPNGDNCHKDRGGKRGSTTKHVLEATAGYAPQSTLKNSTFPFKVARDKLKKRTWAAHSEPWTTGLAAGKTGVLLRPARMAGDAYKLSAYLAKDLDEKGNFLLDVEDKTPDAKLSKIVKASTGSFEIWREIHLVRYIRKQAAIADFVAGNMAGAQAHYAGAFVQLENKIDGDNSYVLASHRKADGSTPDYNALCRSKLVGSGQAIFTKNLAVDATANHAASLSAFEVRDYEGFVKAVHAEVNKTNALAAATDFSGWATATGKTEKQLAEGLGAVATAGWASNARNTRLKGTQTWLNTAQLGTKGRYCKALDGFLFGYVKEIAASSLELVTGRKNGAAAGSKDGVTIMHFDYSNSYLKTLRDSGARVGSKLGSAIEADDGSRTQCAFVFVCARLDTFSHEIGHHMFLPHARGAGGAQLDRHDDVDTGCLMSYNRPRPSFCGLCQLRLRGWDATKLDKIAANNRKT